MSRGLERRIERLEAWAPRGDASDAECELVERLVDVANKVLVVGVDQYEPGSEAERVAWDMARVWRETGDVDAVAEACEAGVVRYLEVE